MSLLPRLRALLLLPAVALLAGGCGRPETAPADALAAYSDSLVYPFAVQPGQAEHRLVLYGTPTGTGLLRVEALRLTHEGAVVQTETGLDAEVPADGAPVTAEDVNFDGYTDVRMMAGLPAGPNVSYLYWLYAPATGRFEPAPALEALSAPTFDPATQTIASEWRDGPARYGRDVYRWEGDELVLVRQEERTYTAPGVYDVVVRERQGGALVETDRQAGVTEDVGGGAAPGDDSRFALLGVPAADVEAFLGQLQDAVAQNDPAQVAALVAFPVQAHLDGQRRGLSRDLFLARYADVVTPAVRQAVAAARPSELFVNDQGAMIGQGEVWFNAFQDTGAAGNPALRVIAFNNEAP